MDSNHRPHDYESCTGCERRRSAVKLGQGFPGNQADRWSRPMARIAGRVRNCRRLVEVVGPPVRLGWKPEPGELGFEDYRTQSGSILGWLVASNVKWPVRRDSS